MKTLLLNLYYRRHEIGFLILAGLVAWGVRNSWKAAALGYRSWSLLGFFLAGVIIIAALVLPFPLVCSIVCIVAAGRNHRIMVRSRTLPVEKYLITNYLI